MRSFRTTLKEVQKRNIKTQSDYESIMYLVLYYRGKREKAKALMFK